MYQTNVMSSNCKIKNNNYWSFLSIKDQLVDNAMTEDCFNQLVNMYLLDIITTQRDRHYANYFLLKIKNDKLWQGIVAIDNAFTLQTACYNQNISAKQLAENIFNDQFGLMRTFQNTCSMQSFSSRLNDINRMIQDGSFDGSQIELLKRVQGYDLESVVERTIADKHIDVSDTQRDLMLYLWEKTQNTLEV